MADPEAPAPVAVRAKALRDLLEEQGRLSADQLEAVETASEEQFDWHNGARVVARAWVDPEFRARLLEDGTAACAELGFAGPQGEYIVVLEAHPELHHVIVCTQCSCTAWPVLGLPPDWYKSPAYRARVAREPRRVLREMGLELPESVGVRVWDTTAETRYLVLPLRPPGTEGFSEERLAGLVSREAMIGVAQVSPPAAT